MFWKYQRLKIEQFWVAIYDSHQGEPSNTHVCDVDNK